MIRVSHSLFIALIFASCAWSLPVIFEVVTTPHASRDLTDTKLTRVEVKRTGGTSSETTRYGGLMFSREISQADSFIVTVYGTNHGSVHQTLLAEKCRFDIMLSDVRSQVQRVPFGDNCRITPTFPLFLEVSLFAPSDPEKDHRAMPQPALIEVINPIALGADDGYSFQYGIKAYSGTKSKRYITLPDNTYATRYTKEHLKFRIKVSVLYTAGLQSYSRTISTMNTVASCWFDVKKKTAWDHTEEVTMPTCAKLPPLKPIERLGYKDADVLQKISDQIGLIKVKITLFDYTSVLLLQQQAQKRPLSNMWSPAEESLKPLETLAIAVPQPTKAIPSLVQNGIKDGKGLLRSL